VTFHPANLFTDSRSDRPLVILCYPRIDFQSNYRYAWIPYSLFFIADALIEQGISDVIIYDANQCNQTSWESIVRQNQRRLLCVGFSIMTGGQQIQHALELANTLADIAPNIPRVFGGPHANVLPAQTVVHPLVTHVLTGPGQHTMPTLVSAFLGLIREDDVPNLWRITDGRILNTTARISPDWTLAPIRHWDNFPLDTYVRNEENIALRTLNYVSSSGCRYGCRFCYEQHNGQGYHALPAERVLSDIAILVDRLNLGGIKFYDANLFMNIKRAWALIAGLGELSPRLAWAASIHPRDIRIMLRDDSAAMHRLFETGCRRLLIGAESGADRVLREIIHKGIDRTEILKSARDVDEAGILGAYTFILGFPGESRQEKLQTVRLAEEIANLSTRPEIRFHGYAPYPGTPLYDDALREGFNPYDSLECWAQFDYYNMRTPWLNDEDLEFIHRWSTATGRRMLEPSKSSFSHKQTGGMQ
jgi:radical SAM superfamily enzyme YgiQ (UPF0313 family)